MQHIRSTLSLCIGLLLAAITGASAQGWRSWQRGAPPAGPGSSAPLVADSAGSVWIGGHYDGVYRFDGTTWTHESDGAWFQCMAVDPQGRVWAFVNGSLSRRNTTGWQYVGTGGSYNEVFQLTIDRKGTPWAVFEPGIAIIDNPTAVLSRYSGVSWKGYSLPFERGATSLAADAQGQIWVGTKGLGLYRFNLDDMQIAEFRTTNSEIPSDTITSLKGGANGEMWIGTPQGLVKYDGHWSVTGQGEHALPNKYVRTMTVDRAGVLWVVTGTQADSLQPLARYDGTQWTRIEGAPYSLGNVWDIAANRQGEVWMGHTGGVEVYSSRPASVIGNGDALSVTLAAVSPNPFTETMSVSLNCRARAHVTVDIVDVQGRIVRNLADEELSAGPHTVTWDGATHDGQPAANGVYYCRVRAGASQQTVPLVRMK